MLSYFNIYNLYNADIVYMLYECSKGLLDIILVVLYKYS